MDDETRARFDTLDRQITAVAAMAPLVTVMASQIAAIVVRLDEQDASHDRLMNKVDRMAANVDRLAVLARAGEEAMTSLDGLARRVARLEAAREGDA